MPLNDCTIATTTEVTDPTMATGAVTWAQATVANGPSVLAAITASWSLISNPYVTGIQFEIVPTDASAPKVLKTALNAALGITISDGIVSGKNYTVRSRAMGLPGYFGSWSSTSTVNAGLAAVAPSSLPTADSTNLIGDPTFLDTSYWTLGAAVSTDTSSDMTATIGAVEGIKHTASGANPQATSFAKPTQMLAVVPNAPLTLSLVQLNKSGFNGQGGVSLTFYKQDKTTSVGSGTLNAGSLTGTDFRTGAAGADLLDSISATVTSPALAAFVDVHYQVTWPGAAASTGVLLQGFPRIKTQAASAGDVTIQPGSTVNLTFNQTQDPTTYQNGVAGTYVVPNGAIWSDTTGKIYLRQSGAWSLTTSGATTVAAGTVMFDSSIPGSWTYAWPANGTTSADVETWGAGGGADGTNGGGGGGYAKHNYTGLTPGSSSFGGVIGAGGVGKDTSSSTVAADGTATTLTTGGTMTANPGTRAVTTTPGSGGTATGGTTNTTGHAGSLGNAKDGGGAGNGGGDQTNYGGFGLSRGTYPGGGGASTGAPSSNGDGNNGRVLITAR